MKPPATEPPSNDPPVAFKKPTNRACIRGSSLTHSLPTARAWYGMNSDRQR
jgi:hypothetical protein